MHRAHDYPHLIRRWRLVARAIGAPLAPFAEAAGYEVVALATPALGGGPALYLSAGIHGDEAGATEGLLAWAEKLGPRLAKVPALILPCLNPWGLVNNQRLNEQGIDLNRAFDRPEIPVIAGLLDRLEGLRFEVAVMLHEDYDGEGVYLYEGWRRGDCWGEGILHAASRIIPVDPRTRIDLVRPRAGLVRRRYDARIHAKLGGLPEAIHLQREHARRTLTFETPSEFALERRIAAQVCCLQACARLTAASAPPKARRG